MKINRLNAINGQEVTIDVDITEDELKRINQFEPAELVKPDLDQVDLILLANTMPLPEDAPFDNSESELIEPTDDVESSILDDDQSMFHIYMSLKEHANILHDAAEHRDLTDIREDVLRIKQDIESMSSRVKDHFGSDAQEIPQEITDISAVHEVEEETESTSS